MTPIVEVIGVKEAHQYQIQLDGVMATVSGALFKMFAILALERVRPGGDGWVNRGVLTHPPENTSRYIYQLRRAIKKAVKGHEVCEWEVSENDHMGNHRLLTTPERIRFPDLAALIAFEDMAITSRLRGPNRVI